DLGFLEHGAVNQPNEAEPAADRVEQAMAGNHRGLVARAWDNQTMDRAALERQPRRVVRKPYGAGEQQVAQHDMRFRRNDEIAGELEPVGEDDLPADFERVVVEEPE